MGSHFHSFFRRRFFSFFFDLGSILGGFGRPKRRPKSSFGRFFFDAFFECVLASIFGRFLEAPNPENVHGATAGARFSQNRRFRKKNEKTSILESFSEAKTMKNRKKMVLKTMCFFDIDFSSLFFDFSRFWLDFGRPRRLQKSIKNRENRVWGDFGTRLGSNIDLGPDFGAILVDLGRILEGF